MLDTPFSPWPSFSEEECQLVASTLQSNKVNYWTGDYCKQFEIAFADYFEADHSVALANGTLALELALRALGIGEGDEVIVTPRSFLASVSCVVSSGARPVFADVDIDTQNLSADTIAEKITKSTKAVIVVHLGGCPAVMDEIVELASTHGLKVIEDCSQAHGAKFKDQAVGTFGDIATWSFCQDKIMTTGGEGGMVSTNDKNLWEFMWSYKDHGKDWQEVHSKSHPTGYRWLHNRFGSNYRMIEMQAVLGLYQLRKLPDWTEKRQKNLNQIFDVARTTPGLRVPNFSHDICHAGYRAYVFVKPDNLKASWSRARIIDEITEAGVPVYTGSCSEIYREKAFDSTSFRPKQPLQVAQELGETSLAFLVHPTLTDSEVEKTCTVIKQVMTRASR